MVSAVRPREHITADPAPVTEPDTGAGTQTVTPVAFASASRRHRRPLVSGPDRNLSLVVARFITWQAQPQAGSAGPEDHIRIVVRHPPSGPSYPR